MFRPEKFGISRAKNSNILSLASSFDKIQNKNDLKLKKV